MFSPDANLALIYTLRQIREKMSDIESAVRSQDQDFDLLQSLQAAGIHLSRAAQMLEKRGK